MSEALFCIDNLKVAYPHRGGTEQSSWAVDVSLNRNERLGLVGESGCGKSTRTGGDAVAASR